MELADIQHEIEALSIEQQKALLNWLAGRECLAWDAQIERDFSPRGAGMELLNQVRTQVANGESEPMAKRPPRR
ncbi:MAG TPA: hypothetical protein VK789_34225 [Bryobacteraceae bacterium]|nr:hypothetical protein [Bryobacteraceae bacterium]